MTGKAEIWERRIERGSSIEREKAPYQESGQKEKFYSHEKEATLGKRPKRRVLFIRKRSRTRKVVEKKSPIRPKRKSHKESGRKEELNSPE
ncbi:hypothetical protein AZF04_15805 [Alkalihalobacillus trypoxylicola]|uniref:Uncharacterized protein n=1 Tax=Alkalihalobacillus trypoxylicola TaxID=519424 RepID=A0A162ETL8_9BACI|nr:hypothetical protein AZF04_15805 [Alkalihalobacillus trypoxylicola]